LLLFHTCSLMPLCATNNLYQLELRKLIYSKSSTSVENFCWPKIWIVFGLSMHYLVLLV
jgi:hypothetical protein